jgi:predicted Rossmann fold nucleotide-binding protein DprA/Smf involved in DNA uptake
MENIENIRSMSKIIIAGSRIITNYQFVVDAVKESGFTLTEIVSGNARGVDSLGEQYARENKIFLKIMPAQWRKHGKSAGYKRNVEMAEYVGKEGALILVWDGKSAGSGHMLNIAKEKGLKVYEKIITT